MNTQRDGSQRAQVFDLSTVRQRLAESKDPSIQDVLEGIRAEKDLLDQTVGRVQKLETELSSNEKRFDDNVAEVAKPIVAQTTKDVFRKTVGLQAVFGLLFVLVCLLAYNSFQSMHQQMGVIHTQMDHKASKQSVDNLIVELATKATKAELKVVETKAEQSVVERLSQELRDKDGIHENRLNDLATDLMAKANKQDVSKLSARLRATRNKVRSLEQRMKELTPLEKPSEVDGLPKTM